MHPQYEARIINAQLIQNGMKRCSRCLLVKPVSEFYPTSIVKGPREVGYFVSRCKQCYAAKRKERPKNTNPEYRARIKAHRQAIRESRVQFLLVYLRSHPCVDCEESDPLVLQFDHKDASKKEYNVGRLCSQNANLVKIQSEMAKCDVRCANCHQRRTAKQRNWLKLSGETAP